MIAWLAETALSAALLAALVAVVARTLRPRAAVLHALWLVVLVRLVAPPVVSWPWSVDPGAVGPLPAVAPEPFAVVVPSEGTGTEGGAAARAPGAATSYGRAAQGLAPANARAGGLDAGGALLALWALGAAVVLGLEARRALALRGALRRGRPLDRDVERELAACADALGVRVPRALAVPGAPCPFVLGLVRPVLVLPEPDEGDDPDARVGVLTHELAHLRRRDHLVAWLELAVRVVHWWNPLQAPIRRRLREAAEVACDAWVVDAWPSRRRRYAETLLSVTERNAHVPTPALAMAPVHRRALERRLLAILEGDARPGLGRTTAAVLGAACLVALPSWSAPDADDDVAPIEPADESVVTSLEARLREVLDAHGGHAEDAAYGLAVVRGDRVVLRLTHGALAADEARPIGTVSGMLSALVAGTLVDRGAVSLDDPVAAILPGAPEHVTLRHLLLHVGGLPPDAPGGNEDPVAALARLGERATPGTTRVPSRIGYALLARALEAAGEAPLDALFDRHVAEPLGLDATRLDAAAPLDGAHASLDDLARIAVAALRPAGAERALDSATARELERAAVAVAGGPIHHSALWRHRFAPMPGPLEMRVRESRTGDDLTLVALVPRTKVAVVLVGRRLAGFGLLASKLGWAASDALSVTAAADEVFESGDFEAAVPLYRKLCAAFPDDGVQHHRLSYALLAIDRPREATDALLLQHAAGFEPVVASYNLACAYAELDEPDAAFRWLERALELGFRDDLLLRKDEDLASLRDDPRWSELRIADY